MFTKIPNTRIAALRCAVPAQTIRIEDELEFYGGSLKKAQRAKAMIGIDQRRLAWPGQTASDLCHAAAADLLAAHPQAAAEMDALIFVSQSPDYDLPATACVLHKRLDLPKTCAAFDVNQGCAGFVYGLWLGASLINSGCRNVLLLAGDVPYRPRPEANRVMAPIFGDGGSAALLCRADGSDPLCFMLGADGSGFEHIIMPAGRGRLPLKESLADNAPLFEDIQDQQGNPWRLIDTCMDGKAVFSFTLNEIPGHIREFLLKNGRPPESIDYFFLHQANRQIVTEVAKKAGLPLDKTPTASFSRYGNLSSASIPAAICDFFGAADISGEFLLCGFGVGLAWGSCLWRADCCDIRPVIDVARPEVETFEEQTARWRKKLSGASDE